MGWGSQRSFSKFNGHEGDPAKDAESASHPHRIQSIRIV
jgi:hypothetical protein